jgi:hypothetical protein
LETTPEEASPKSLVSCDSANAYTSLAPATEVEGTPRADTAETRDRSPGYPRVPLRRHCFAEQQPRTRHRTKLETQWDRSGHRPTWGHFLSRSVETPESVITTIAFQQGGTAKYETSAANACRPTVSAVSDPATQATPENRPFYGTSFPETSLHVRFSLVSAV